MQPLDESGLRYISVEWSWAVCVLSRRFNAHTVKSDLCSNKTYKTAACFFMSSLMGSRIEKGLDADLVCEAELCSYPTESSPPGRGSSRRTRSSACGAGGRTCYGDTWYRLSLSIDPWTPGEQPCTWSWVTSCRHLQVKLPLWLCRTRQNFVVIPKAVKEWRGDERNSQWDSLSSCCFYICLSQCPNGQQGSFSQRSGRPSTFTHHLLGTVTVWVRELNFRLQIPERPQSIRVTSRPHCHITCF